MKDQLTPEDCKILAEFLDTLQLDEGDVTAFIEGCPPHLWDRLLELRAKLYALGKE